MDAVSGVNMLPQLQDVAGGGGAALSPAGSTTNNNTSVSFSPTQGTDNRGCENGALMDSFGIFLQGLLAMVAFSTLMCESLPLHSTPPHYAHTHIHTPSQGSVSDIWLQLLGGRPSVRQPPLLNQMRYWSGTWVWYWKGQTEVVHFERQSQIKLLLFFLGCVVLIFLLLLQSVRECFDRLKCLHSFGQRLK